MISVIVVLFHALYWMITGTNLAPHLTEHPVICFYFMLLELGVDGLLYEFIKDHFFPKAKDIKGYGPREWWD